MNSYGEVLGEIIYKDILKIEDNYEVNYDTLMFDVAGIQICKKEHMLNVLAKNNIVIMYSFTYKQKKLVEKLNSLYKEKLESKSGDYIEINNKIEEAKESIKYTLTKTLKKASVSANYKTIICPIAIEGKIKIAEKIIGNEKIDDKYKTRSFLLGTFQETVQQVFNFIKNIFHI